MQMRVDFVSGPKNEQNHVHIYAWGEANKLYTFTTNEGSLQKGDKIEVSFCDGQPVYSELKKIE